MKKVIIVDDEASGRKLIREYITDHPELILIGEANNGVDAVKMINEFRPDLLFLDVQMPGMNGFEMLPYLDEVPQIIFSTAYDEYALKAFEVHAADYLLKPYTRDRFKKALERIINATDHPIVPLIEKIMQEQAKFAERVLVQSGKKFITVAIESIQRIEAMGDYSRLHTDGQAFTSNYGISQLEERLDPGHFIRVHRSAIINLRSIKEVNKYPSGYDVILLNGDAVTVSRGYLENFKKLIF